MRGRSKTTSVIQGAGKSARVYTDAEAHLLDSPEWFAWLAKGETFSFEGVTFRAEKRRQGLSWYAFKKIAGKTHKVYVGRVPALTSDRLRVVCGLFPVSKSQI